MHCLVVKIRAEGLSDVEAVALSLTNLSEVLLLVQDEVLGARNYILGLDALDGGSNELAG